MRTFLFSAFLCIFSVAQASAIVSFPEIFQEIRDDAKSGFYSTQGKTWIIEGVESECANATGVALLPAGAFEVRRIGNGVFEVQLVNSQLLLTPFGEFATPTVQYLGCGEAAPPTVRKEVGLVFETAVGGVLPVSRIKDSPNYSAFKVSVSPKRAKVLRYERDKVIFQRDPGYGLFPITATLSFVYQGQEYSYSQRLPTLDDGYDLKWEVPTNAIFSRFECGEEIQIRKSTGWRLSSDNLTTSANWVGQDFVKEYSAALKAACNEKVVSKNRELEEGFADYRWRWGAEYADSDLINQQCDWDYDMKAGKSQYSCNLWTMATVRIYKAYGVPVKRVP